MWLHFTNASGKPASVAAELIQRVEQLPDGSELFLSTGVRLATQDTVAAVQADLDALREASQQLVITDGITAPGATIGVARIYVDSADGDLKCKFSDGTTKTIVVDT